jgi:hypothetical protein
VNEAEANIRESLLNTLSFLASEAQQREFAAEVFYASYQDEFACWWFDTFYPDEPSALAMFNSRQLSALTAFSQVFDRNLETIGDEVLTIDQLQSKPEWQAVVASAKETCANFNCAP